MKPDYERNGIQLYHGKAEEILPELPQFDALVIDPPYGIGEASGKNKTRGMRYGRNKQPGLNHALAVSKDYGDQSWDDKPISPELMQLARDHGRWQVIFGGNYYALPPTSCWLVWDKMNGNTDFADCELAWTNLKKAVRQIRYQWHGMIRDGDDVRVHPTQKPVDVMRWCLGHLPEDAKTVLDSFMGSGTTAVACIRTGKEFVGIEQEANHFESAVARVEAEFARCPLFEPKERQVELFPE